MSKSIDFIKEWNAAQSKIGGVKVMPLTYVDDLYGLEIRFPGTAYEVAQDQFVDIKGALARRSGGTIRFSTSWHDFRAGIISLSVACANHAYSDDETIKALKLLLTEILPSFKK